MTEAATPSPNKGFYLIVNHITQTTNNNYE